MIIIILVNDWQQLNSQENKGFYTLWFIRFPADGSSFKGNECPTGSLVSDYCFNESGQTCHVHLSTDMIRTYTMQSVTLPNNIRTPWPLGHAELNTAYSNTRLYMWYLYILHSNQWDSMVKMNATFNFQKSRDKIQLHNFSIGKEILSVLFYSTGHSFPTSFLSILPIALPCKLNASTVSTITDK